jgi:hypothetical protein
MEEPGGASNQIQAAECDTEQNAHLLVEASGGESSSK